jgi:hypothetical protein
MWLEQMQHGELMTKDNFLIYKMFNIMNIRQKWASSIMPKTDALNVKMWALDNEESIFFLAR